MQTNTTNRRTEQRFVDGTETDVRCPDGHRVMGLIIDVGFNGVQLWTDRPVTRGEHVSCRIQFERHTTDLPLRVVWSKQGDNGWTSGAVYEPVVARGPRLIDAYRNYVLHRHTRNLSDVWAC